MQKKMVGILASVAAAHAVLAIALITGGGCHQPKLLGPHTYNNGPEFAEIPAAATQPADAPAPAAVPQVPVSNEPVVLPPPPAKPVYPVQEPVAAVNQPVKTGTLTYTVKRGDTLSLIAYKHGVRTRDLAACNNLSGKAMNRIRIGQVLNIPENGVYDAKRQPKKRAAAKPAKAAKKSTRKVAELPADGIYVVKAGDSLDRIGRRYGVTAAAIAKENNIALTKILQIGDKLRIPGKAAAKTAAPAGTVDEKPAADVSLDNTLSDLDPNIGLNSTSAAAETVAAPAASAAAAPAASAAPAAPAAVESTAAPANDSRTESIEVPEDTTVEAYSTKIMVSVEDLRRLNPSLPADGKIKGGTYLVIPVL